MKTLGERLRWAREVCGLSARALDEIARLTPGHTASIEGGRRVEPSVATVDAIAVALGVSLEWLVAGRGIAPTERALRLRAKKTGTDD